MLLLLDWCFIEGTRGRKLVVIARVCTYMHMHTKKRNIANVNGYLSILINTLHTIAELKFLPSMSDSPRSIIARRKSIGFKIVKRIAAWKTYGRVASYC